MKNPLKRPLTEQKVLDKLQIEDFRHLSKDKVIEFVSMVPDMDPEVAKAAIAQFPEFSNTVKSIVVDYKEELETVLKNNDDSVKANYDACKSIINSLDKMLDNDELSHKERMQIIGKMQEVQKTMSNIDSENKKFLRDMAAIAGLVVVTVAGTMAALLGGDSDFKLPTKKDWLAKRTGANPVLLINHPFFFGLSTLRKLIS